MSFINNYFIQSSICISMFYIVYLLTFRNEQNFKLVRLFLLLCIGLSLILPLNPVSLEIPIINQPKQVTINTKPEQILEIQRPENFKQAMQVGEIQTNTFEKQNSAFDYKALLINIYLTIVALILARLALSIGKILYFYFSSEKIKYQHYTIVLLEKKIVAFTFFNWIFVDKNCDKTDLEQIIKHEKIHASQYHSIDVLLSELLVATMWFNPFTWMFKKALQQVHEFLADEGVINSGFDRLEYQTLLVNQAAEERLVAVSSNFSYSLIKKRIIMMSKTKERGGKKIKLLVMLPALVVLFIAIAGFNKPTISTHLAKQIANTSSKQVQERKPFDNKMVTTDQKIETQEEIADAPKDTIPKKDNFLVAVSPTKMNVLYVGVDNPIDIAVTGASKDRITAEIDNGILIKSDNGYIARVRQLGIATITVKVDGKIVSTQQFRIKKVPDPVPAILGKWGQKEYTKEGLIQVGQITIILTNFDFDLKFECVGYSMYISSSQGNSKIVRTDSYQFNKEQIEMINSTLKGDKVIFEDILAKAPDGTIRNLGSLVITII